MLNKPQEQSPELIANKARFSLTRRWVRSRPGSVLILVIALLVLLALIGTAYLSSTQTERYTSVQNTANTQADLLIDGVVLNVESKISNSLYGTTGSSFRPPVSINLADPTAANPSYQTVTNPGYNTFTSAQSDDFLADRAPVISPVTTLGGALGVPTWGSISWPLFTDSASNYSFDSPFVTSSQNPTPMFSLNNKANIVSIPTSKTINGHVYPAMLYYVPPNATINTAPPAGQYFTASANGAYLISSTLLNQNQFVQVGSTVYVGSNPVTVPVPSTVVQNPDNFAPLLNIAASATGEGVADSGLFKVPTGPIDGITYYAAMRVIDNNSAVNVSTAWSATLDPSVTGVAETDLVNDYINIAKYTNYGFFRSNIGLRELLNNVPTTPKEMDFLNNYRFNQVLNPTLNGGTPVPSISAVPLDDKSTPRPDYTWFSIDGSTYLAGDALDSQLARKTLDAGYNTASQKYLYMDKIQSAALASRFSLVNPNASLSTIEQLLPYQTNYDPLSPKTFPNNAYPSTPYSPTQVGTVLYANTPVAQGTWYGDLFDFHQFNNYPGATYSTPNRPLLTASNPVSNGTATRLGNVTTGLPAYPSIPANAPSYSFGDLVTYTEPTATNVTHTFVCLQPLAAGGVDAYSANASTAPPVIKTLTPTNVSSNQYWSMVPFTNQPVKTSVNAGTFEQLWMAFCQVMTDSVAAPGKDVTSTPAAPSAVPQWQPPLMPTAVNMLHIYGEEQMPQFRSVIRDNRNWPQSNVGNTGQPGSAAKGLVQSPTYGAGVVPPAVPRVQMTPMQMLQLRAAIAAINALGMRNVQSDISGVQLGGGGHDIAADMHPDGGILGGGNGGLGGGAGPLTASTHATRSRRIVLPDTSGKPAFEAEVFANDIQAYIGQMYAYAGGLASPSNYIAIQMVNPYPYPLTCAGWAFTTINRNAPNPATPGSPYLTLNTVEILPDTTSITIPPATVVGGVLVPGIAVFYDGTAPSQFPPLPTATSYQISGLASAAIGNEVMILRRRNFNGKATYCLGSLAAQKYGFADRYNEKNVYDLVPVDQIDLTGADTATYHNLYYRRAADPAVAAPAPGMNTYSWNFIWPGFYTPYNPGNLNGKTAAPPTTPTSAPLATYALNQAIIASATDPTSQNINFAKLGSGAPITTITPDSSPTAPTYNTITLQVSNTNVPGANPVTPYTTGNCFPFGGFARNVDMLQIPYIGSYRIINYNQQLDDKTNNPTSAFYEMNSITMDAALANDSTLQPSAANATTYTTTFPNGLKVTPSTAGSPTPTIAADIVTDPFVEQIGHFCPIGKTNTAYTYNTNPPDATASNTLLDFGNDAKTPGLFWHYHWTKRLFDYLSVQTPNDDYYPNVDPDREFKTYSTTGRQKYIAGAVTPTLNTSATGATANVGEDTVGVEGLININTAPWPVLATLPFVPRNISNTAASVTHNITYTGITTQTTPNTTGTGTDDNILLAKAIVDYRTVNGPFKSIFDLYNVPAFRLENDALLVTDPGAKLGDFSPGGINPANLATNGSDAARFDFEERFLLLNQISNLITTRSDTFTCYVDLQGWRNVGTGSPTLAVERRRAFIFDRTAYTPTYKNPVYFPVSTGN